MVNKRRSSKGACAVPAKHVKVEEEKELEPDADVASNIREEQAEVERVVKKEEPETDEEEDNDETSDEDEEENDDENGDEEEIEEDDGIDCPELTTFFNRTGEAGTVKMLETYERDLLLVDETPEERREIEEHPERPVFAMRNTSSSNVMQGLIAGWILEIRGKEVGWVKMIKHPKADFRKLLCITLAAFRDEHWYMDTDSPEIVHSLVKDIGDLWKHVFNRSNAELKITEAFRKELKELLLKHFAEEAASNTDEWRKPVEFIYTAKKGRSKVKMLNLKEIQKIGADIKAGKDERNRLLDAEFKTEATAKTEAS